MYTVWEYLVILTLDIVQKYLWIVVVFFFSAFDTSDPKYRLENT